MPGDPKECRQHAERCGEHARLASTQEARETLQDLGSSPLKRRNRKGRRPKPTPCVRQVKTAYCFSTHFLLASSHTLPAFSQSSLFVIVEPGPANAGAANATAIATARMVETPVPKRLAGGPVPGTPGPTAGSWRAR
jgi:hypothetical protein